ncbi:DUF2971 domain-containing protein [Clostridium sporogenes]|nr:DUF2971 domain-containing protein [Clostridium sporogenes]MCF4018374.1 DUF2971 domain-containing protein [Clostridium sporogenes]
MENKEFTYEFKLLDEGIKLFEEQEYEKSYQYFSEIVKLKNGFNRDLNIRLQTSYFLGLSALKLQYLEVSKECLITLKHDVKPLVNNEKVLQNISDLEVELVKNLLQEGIENGIKGNHEEALKCFDTILELDKNNIEAVYNKGIACYHLKKYKVTKECFIKIYKETNSKIYLLNMGLMFHDMNEDDKAFECLERVTGDIPLTFAKAELLSDLKVPQAKKMSNECFEQITQKKIRENNKYDYMYKCLANLLKEDRDFKQACSIYWKSIKNRDCLKKKKNEESFSYYNSFSPFLYNFLYNLSSVQEKEEIEVFHYTDINALKSILENKKLWVTRADFLNDLTETKYICDIVNSICEEEFAGIKNIKYGLNLFYENKQCDNYMENVDIKKYIENNRTKNKKEIYILSTTQHEDSLPMWLNYSNCDGYNIKINHAKYEKYLKSNGILNLHGEVVYVSCNDKKSSDKREKIINFIKGVYLSGKENNITPIDIEFSIISNLTILALFIKHPGFEYEKEYRFAFFSNYWNGEMGQVYNVLSQIKKFRTKNNKLIPYIEIPINKESIEQITMSPTCNELNEIGLKEFLESIEFNVYDIEKSHIPYRKI